MKLGCSRPVAFVNANCWNVGRISVVLRPKIIWLMLVRTVSFATFWLKSCVVCIVDFHTNLVWWPPLIIIPKNCQSQLMAASSESASVALSFVPLLLLRQLLAPHTFPVGVLIHFLSQLCATKRLEIDRFLLCCVRATRACGGGLHHFGLAASSSI